MALLETLTDDFNDNSRDPVKWGQYGTQVDETSGLLTVVTQLAAEYGGYYSRSSYNLTSSSAYIQLADAGNQSIASLEVFALDVILNSSNKLQFMVTGNSLKARKIVAGVTTVVSSTTYSASSHKWLRIRESGGTIYWDYSSDATTWNNFTTLANPFAITAITLEIDAGTYSTESVQTTIVFDNLNTPPAASPDIPASIPTGGVASTDHSSDIDRDVDQNVQVSWKRDYRSTITLFTIGVSTIGGNDYIGGSAIIPVQANWYRYSDETAYVTQLDYERQYDLPLGGIAKAQADVSFDNTSGRFTPRYMGGSSELFTAILPQRPIIINTGFSNNPIAQFIGVIDKQPEVDQRRREMGIHASDFLDVLGKKFIDDSAMYTSVTSDEIIETLLTQLGFSTSQYELDTGINVIDFTLFDKGSSFLKIINDVVVAENGHFYQDEEGIFRFENRQHWDTPPNNVVSQVIYTADVLESNSPDDDHIINVVEVIGKPREVQENQLVWQTSGFAGAGNVEINGGADKEVWANFDDPMFTIDTPASGGTTSVFVANTSPDGEGTDMTSSVYLKSIAKFTNSCKMTFHNNSSGTVYLSQLDLWGRPARRTGDVYYRESYDSSVTAFDERKITIESDYIQSLSWAESYARLILEQFSQPENLQIIVIRAKPQLSIGDLISWQGRYWYIYGIKSKMNASEGFVQELRLVQRISRSYFRIGVSTIGGADVIAP